MGYKSRKQLYQEFEEMRGRPLISYVTSICVRQVESA